MAEAIACERPAGLRGVKRALVAARQPIAEGLPWRGGRFLMWLRPRRARRNGDWRSRQAAGTNRAFDESICLDDGEAARRQGARTRRPIRKLYEQVLPRTASS